MTMTMTMTMTDSPTGLMAEAYCRRRSAAMFDALLNLAHAEVRRTREAGQDCTYATEVLVWAGLHAATFNTEAELAEKDADEAARFVEIQAAAVPASERLARALFERENGPDAHYYDYGADMAVLDEMELEDAAAASGEVGLPVPARGA